MSQDTSPDHASSARQAAAQRRDMIVTVRWALILACAYLVLFNDGSGSQLLGPLAIAAYLASNLIVGRLEPETVNTQGFNVGIALLDSVFIAASLYLAGQLQVELVVLCLGVLVLAIAGFRLGIIAGATLAMTAAYLMLVWVGGSESLWRTSMLLRVPFLLCAAMVYSWVTDAAHGRSGHEEQTIAKALVADLGVQLEAIRRCQSVIGGDAARIALADVAHINKEMQAKLTGAPAVPAETGTAA